MELGATTIQMITTKEGWCMCNESRDCKLKGSLKGYAMLCLSENYRISLNSFLKISSFFNLEIVENSNSCHKLFT